MKKLRVTYELINDNGKVLHSCAHEVRASDGLPRRPMTLQGNGSLFQIDVHHDADRFWQEIVMLGFLDGDIRSERLPLLLSKE